MSINDGFIKRKRYQENGNNEKDLLSYWTNWETVECHDKSTDEKQTLEEKIGSLKAEIHGKAPAVHTADSNKYGIATAHVYGHAMAGGDEVCTMASGNGYPGTDNGKYARANHVHKEQVNISGSAEHAKVADKATVADSAGKLNHKLTFNGYSFDPSQNMSINTHAVLQVPERGFLSNEERLRWEVSAAQIKSVNIAIHLPSIANARLYHCNGHTRLKLRGTTSTFHSKQTYALGNLYSAVSKDYGSLFVPELGFLAILPVHADTDYAIFAKVEIVSKTNTSGSGLPGDILLTPYGTLIPSANNFYLDILYN